MKVGFIGLGTMGAGMARNLQRAGHELTVHDLRREAADPFVTAGAVWAESPRAVAAVSQVIFTSLPGPPEVETVALGRDGLLAGMREDAAYFDLSTISPATVRKVHAAFADKGAHMLDAPVSGGPRGAATGRLALWIGGERTVFDRYKHVLDAFADQVRYVGPAGQATVVKLVHNCSGYAINAALAEVFALGVKAGVDPLVLFAAIRQGAVGRRRTYDGLIDQFLPGRYEPPAFALRLAHKDVSLGMALAKELGVPMALCDRALDDMSAALARGWGERDSRAALLLQLERAGVEIAVAADRVRQSLAADATTASEP
jgi:3-hydroxyisobutyrate dehydrogenase-like beta-hydroxyacid dehydrogenase